MVYTYSNFFYLDDEPTDRTYLNYLFADQELRQSFVDMGFMRNVLVNVKPTIVNDPTAPSIDSLTPRNGPSTIEFRYL
jgi:hypothetical protein